MSPRHTLQCGKDNRSGNIGLALVGFEQNIEHAFLEMIADESGLLKNIQTDEQLADVNVASAFPRNPA